MNEKIKASEHDQYGTTTIIALLLPLVGIVLGIVYLTKSTKVEHKLGEHLVAVSILAAIVGAFIWTVWSGLLLSNSL